MKHNAEDDGFFVVELDEEAGDNEPKEVRHDENKGKKRGGEAEET